jgi:hypothetical protein
LRNSKEFAASLINDLMNPEIMYILPQEANILC